jgi:hypothetical protein
MQVKHAGQSYCSAIKSLIIQCAVNGGEDNQHNRNVATYRLTTIPSTPHLKKKKKAAHRSFKELPNTYGNSDE